MNQAYRDAVTKMEEMNVQSEYLLGWQGGYLGHPMREEQRLTEAYEAGYEDGSAKSLDNLELGRSLVSRTRQALSTAANPPKIRGHNT